MSGYSLPLAQSGHASQNTVRSAVLALLLSGGAALLTWLALYNWLYAAAIVYAITFMAVAWYWPHIALMLVVAASPFQNDLSSGGGAKFGIGEINLALSLPVFLVRNIARKRPLTLGPLTVPILLYFAICLYSSSVYWRGDDAILSMGQMVLYLVLAIMIFASFAEHERDLILSLNALVCVSIFLSLAGIATSFTFLGLNKNGIGSSLSCALIVCVELWFSASNARRRSLLLWAMAIIAVGLVLSLSRGAWLGFFMGFILIIMMRRQYNLALRVVLVLVPLIALCWTTLPKEQREYATGFGRDRYNINARYESVDYAKGQWERRPIYGNGVGLRKEYDATNLMWLTLAETGVLGVIALALIHFVFFRMVWTVRNYFDHSEPAFSLLAVGGALVLSKLTHGMVDHYWSRGPLMLAWAAAGMAIGAYYTACRRIRLSAVNQ